MNMNVCPVSGQPKPRRYLVARAVWNGLPPTLRANITRCRATRNKAGMLDQALSQQTLRLQLGDAVHVSKYLSADKKVRFLPIMDVIREYIPASMQSVRSLAKVA